MIKSLREYVSRFSALYMLFPKIHVPKEAPGKCFLPFTSMSYDKGHFKALQKKGRPVTHILYSSVHYFTKENLPRGNCKVDVDVKKVINPNPPVLTSPPPYLHTVFVILSPSSSLSLPISPLSLRHTCTHTCHLCEKACCCCLMLSVDHKEGHLQYLHSTILKT